MAEGPKRRIVFMGTPAFAAGILKALLDSEDYETAAVYARPDKKAGRGMKTVFSETKKLALERGLTLRQPASFRSEEAALELASFEPDYLVVAAYGLILPDKVLSVPKIAPVNVHASLLPALRGAAPIQRAIMENPGEDAKTGVSIMKIIPQLDAGPVYAACEVPIMRKDYPELEKDLSRVGASLLLKTLRAIDNEGLAPLPQDESQATFAPKLEKADGFIDWTKSAEEVDALVRAVIPWPGAQTVFSIQSASNDLPITILSGRPGAKSAERPGAILRHKNGLSIACADRWYELGQARPQGGKPMSAADLANGRIKSGYGICGSAAVLKP